MVVISGPSGVGKSTICRRLLQILPDGFLSISCTTRQPGPGEVDGRDYWFIPKERFEQMISNGMFLEYAEVFGNLYGTPRGPIEEALSAGRTVILEIDVQGGRQVKQAFADGVMVFIMPPQDQALWQRLVGRAREDRAAMARRLQKAREEIEAAKGLYEHFVVNDDLQKAVDQIIAIISHSKVR